MQDSQTAFYAAFLPSLIQSPTTTLTDEEYIEMCAEKAREEAKEVLKYHIRPFNCVKEQFVPNNMSNKEFKQIIKKMETPRK